MHIHNLYPEQTETRVSVLTELCFILGGWLLVSNIVVQNSTLSSRVQLPAKISYRGIGSDQMVLMKIAMKELFTHYPFTQLRFHCSKNKGQRTFHVITAANSSGEAVVRYFGGQTDVMPDSCVSFVRMEDDNSRLARNCTEWGHQSGSYRIGKWGHGGDQKRLYEFPALVGHAYHWMLDPQDRYGLRYECDDTMASGVSIGDFWKVYVR